MYKILKQEGRAKRAEVTTVHGTIQTPVFMNVGTQGAIKGAVSAHDLKEIGCQVELSNTYHLHLRPGDGVVRQMGGLHKFMGWDGPMLTDSGGFQVFSLSGLRKIKEEGVSLRDNHRERLAEAMARSCCAPLFAAGGAGSVTTMEAEALIRKLFSCDEPNYTPDGRPVMSVVSALEAEKRLKR